MRFVVATRDYAGLGFAMRLGDEGHEVLLATAPEPGDVADARYDAVGRGLVPKAPLSAVLEDRRARHDAYWIWDGNHSVEENERLRAEGFKVLGGGRYADQMEHDRQACLDLVGRYGLKAPASQRFEDPAEAIAFCEAHAETAYVYKPDEGAKHETFVPDEDQDPAEANQALRVHLRSLEPRRAFLLQERKDGVETNVEVWLQKGEPVFAFMTLECKRKCALDLGPMVGCALDYVFTIPLDCRAVAESVGRMLPEYRRMKYTGFADANFIAAKDGLWFFEKCERFGYNSHPNLLFTLARRGVGEIFSQLVDGTFAPDFAEGFGSSATMSTKENAPGGEAILFPEKIAKDLYLWDARREDGVLLTCGFDPDGDLLIVTGYGPTMAQAWEAVAKRAAQVRFPYRHYRPDGDQTNYPSSPLRRYEALKAMGYI
jgi:phosphoribosylamine-glycine ligase